MSSELTAEVVKQLNSLPAFPRADEFKLGDWVKNCQLCPAAATIAALPLTGNTTGDIRFVNSVGYFYYWNGTAWDAAAGRLMAVKAADQQVTNSTTVVNDNELFVTLQSNQKYRIRGIVFANIISDGIRLTLNGPSITITDMKCQIRLYDSSLRTCDRITTLGQEVSHAAAGPGDHFLSLDGVINVATGGVLYLKWAQHTSVLDPLTVQKDSFLEFGRTG